MLTDDLPTCPTCGGQLPCKGCAANAQPAGSELTDRNLRVTFPIQTDGTAPIVDETYFDLMLQRRGLQREDWIVDRWKANEWDAVRKHDRGVIRLSQTTVWFIPAVTLQDSVLGGFLAGLAAIRPLPLDPLRRLKPVDGPKRVLLAGDHQAPFINRPFHELACEALGDIQPDEIVYMGDGVEFDPLTRHRKKADRFTATVTEGLGALHQLLADLRDASSLTADAGLWFLYGNHEDRLRKSINEKLPELAGLRRPLDDHELLSIEYLADFAKLGYEAVTDSAGNYPYGTLQLAPGTGEQPPLVATHGWVARQHAGASALASMEHLNASIAVGHTHRGAVTSLTRWDSVDGATVPRHYLAIETGTFADLEGLGYSKWPDWQPMFVTVEVGGDGGYHADTATFDGRSLRWRDWVWERTATGVRRG